MQNLMHTRNKNGIKNLWALEQCVKDFSSFQFLILLFLLVFNVFRENPFLGFYHARSKQSKKNFQNYY
jgi:hypothetical protein